MVFWYLRTGRAKNPGPGPPHHLAVEVFHVGGWLAHGDFAKSASLDFLAVAEHRLIPARVRSEWTLLLSGRLPLKILLMWVMLISMLLI